jgi:hypothetical protein
VACGGTAHAWPAQARGVDILFDRTKRQSFPKVFGSNSLVITVLDRYSNSVSERRAQAVLPLADLQLKDPLYLWLPVPQVPRRRVYGVKGASERIKHFCGALKESILNPAQEAGSLPFDPLGQRGREVLVFLRLHATPSLQSHAQMSITVKLTGGGIIVGNGVDEELAALSFHALKTTLELRATEVTLAGTLNAVQIDDQSLATHQPVVLGPAGIVSKGAEPALYLHIVFGVASTPVATAIIQALVLQSLAAANRTLLLWTYSCQPLGFAHGFVSKYCLARQQNVLQGCRGFLIRAIATETGVTSLLLQGNQHMITLQQLHKTLSLC